MGLTGKVVVRLVIVLLAELVVVTARPVIVAPFESVVTTAPEGWLAEEEPLELVNVAVTPEIVLPAELVPVPVSTTILEPAESVVGIAFLVLTIVN